MMVVGVCRLTLLFSGSNSLKTKRQGLRKIIDRLKSRFNVAIAEVGGQDTWQRSVVGFVVVGNEGGHVRTMVDKISRAAEELYVAQIVDRDVDLLHYDEHEPLAATEGTWAGLEEQT